MTDQAQDGAAGVPLRPAELLALRTDYEDVVVPALGDRTVRVYALSGVARARLMPTMSSIAEAQKPGEKPGPETVAAILVFQSKVVAASLGYGEDDWPAVGDVLPADATTALYQVAARLSGLDEAQQAEAVQRLPRTRRAASGTV